MFDHKCYFCYFISPNLLRQISGNLLLHFKLTKYNGIFLENAFIYAISKEMFTLCNLDDENDMCMFFI